ncbi:MAG: pilus assembly protein N-terminal domain-containing protein, partial [Candidatus Pacebacteria bacterium]|nr:pilus assembly protein N-terminal domain-containing protein [Candidatus Paceibacterota bacterium]
MQYLKTDRTELKSKGNWKEKKGVKVVMEQIMSKRVLGGVLFSVCVIFLAGSLRARQIELQEGTTELVEVKGIQRVIVKDKNVIEADTTGKKDELLISGKRFGTTEADCRLADGDKETIDVTVRPKYWGAMLAILKDQPQISAEIVGNYIVL